MSKPYQSHWRNTFAPIIARVIAAHAGKPHREIREALRPEWIWGPRQYHPYKIWIDEIQRQLGEKAPLGKPGVKPGQHHPAAAADSRQFVFDVFKFPLRES